MLLRPRQVAFVDRDQDGGILALAGFEAWAVVQRHGKTWAAVGGVQPRDGERSARVIASGDRTVCLARADDFMNTHESDESAHRTRHWTSQPPTERQMAYLPALAGDAGLTRYAASCHLTRRFNRRTIDRLLAAGRRTGSDDPRESA